MSEQRQNPAWPDIVNFRDVGGVMGADGHLVKTGLIFRGIALNDASAQDLAKLAGLGIGLVFDLRGLGEAASWPDRLPPGADYRREAAMLPKGDDPMESLNWEAFMQQVAASPQALAAALVFQANLYADMIRRPNAFNVLLHEMLTHPGRGVYIHCSAGKDRTGIACAIIARLLGVGYDDALADYLKSADYPLPDFDVVRARAAELGVSALIDPMTEVSKPQFDTMYAEPDQAWGSWDGFVRDGLGLGDHDVAQLRQMYLIT